jgi:hypothetical protein
MTEACFCGRTGHLTDRIPVLDDEGVGLECPECAHVDRLTVFPAPVRLQLWTEAKAREAWPVAS